MPLHIINTWFVANLIHPLVILMLRLIVPSYFTELDFVVEPGFLWMVFICSLVLSLPALLFAYICLSIIVPAPHSFQTRLIVWIIAAPCTIAFEAFIVMIIFYGFDPKVLIICIPAMIAVLLTILIRYQQFKRLIVQHEINLIQ